MLDAQRVEIMDTQRFDVSKRSPRSSTQITESTVVDDPTAVKNPPSPVSRPRTTNLQIGAVWNHYERVFVPAYSAPSSTSSDTDGDSTSAATDSLSDPNSTRPPSSPDHAPLDDEGDPDEFRQTDVYDNGEFTTTRTIVRPAPRSPCLGFFSALSRPSSPFSRPSSPCTSRPSSPVNLSLSCFSTPSFELDLDATMQKEEAQPLRGIEVVVTQEVSVLREELWREAVQEVLYGQGQNYDMRRRLVGDARVRHEA